MSEWIGALLHHTHGAQNHAGSSPTIETQFDNSEYFCNVGSTDFELRAPHTPGGRPSAQHYEGTVQYDNTGVRPLYSMAMGATSDLALAALANV